MPFTAITASAPSSEKSIHVPDPIVTTGRTECHESFSPKDTEVVLSAPTWVLQLLQRLAPDLQGTELHLPSKGKLEVFSGVPELLDLQKMTRIQAVNTDGSVDFDRLYKGLPRDLILTLIDLVKQCILVGRIPISAYGGFPKKTPRIPLFPPYPEVYFCDFAGLQYQKPYNTGRLTIHGPRPLGRYDDDIFQQVVGEPRPLSLEACKEKPDRYHPISFFGDDCYFDSVAYQCFVAQDVVTFFRALIATARVENNFLVLAKFLRHGTGAFAGKLGLGPLVERYFSKGVLRGLTHLFTTFKEEVWDVDGRCPIQVIDFPFYPDTNDEKAIAALCDENHIPCTFSKNDFFKPGRTLPDKEGVAQALMTGTNACGDSLVRAGNERKHGASVDAQAALNTPTDLVAFDPFQNSRITQRLLLSYADPGASATVAPPTVTTHTPLTVHGASTPSPFASYSAYLSTHLAQQIYIAVGLLGFDHQIKFLNNEVPRGKEESIHPAKMKKALEWLGVHVEALFVSVSRRDGYLLYFPKSAFYLRPVSGELTVASFDWGLSRERYEELKRLEPCYSSNERFDIRELLSIIFPDKPEPLPSDWLSKSTEHLGEKLGKFLHDEAFWRPYVSNFTKNFPEGVVTLQRIFAMHDKKSWSCVLANMLTEVSKFKTRKTPGFFSGRHEITQRFYNGFPAPRSEELDPRRAAAILQILYGNIRELTGERHHPGYETLTEATEDAAASPAPARP